MIKPSVVELVGKSDRVIVSGIGYREAEGIKLAQDPDEIFDAAFNASTIPAGLGGRLGRIEVPPRQMTLTFNLSDAGVGIEATISRFRKLWGSQMRPSRVQWVWSSQESGTRWLYVWAVKQIKFSPARDWNLDGYARAVVSVVALEPRYESHPYTAEATTTAANQTIWFPVWNPTDQVGWPNWSLLPNGANKRFTFPDFSFGQEQDIDRSWPVGSHSGRTVQTVPISVPWNVIPVRSGMDPYVAADLSNASGQMGGLFPLYGMPARAGSEQDPVLLPVTVTGAAGATIRLEMRRFWSAESGLE